MSTLREETRDRYMCLEEQPLPPPPMRVMPLSVFKELMYKYAYTVGFEGTKEEIDAAFGNALSGTGGESQINKIIVRSEYNNFPITGENDKFYLDTNTNILYIWNGKYIEVSSQGLKDNTILFGGEAFVEELEL